MNRLRAALALSVVALVLTGCGSSDSPSSSPTSGSASCSYPDFSDAAKKVNKPSTSPSDLPKTITITTNSGDVPLTLDGTQAPCTVNSFVSLAQQGFYDNTPCHRMLTGGDYILQCGDPSGTGGGGPGYTIPDELVTNDPRLQPCDATTGTCVYPAGTIAMANRSAPGSGGSQFFLMYDDSPFPPNYTVFGHTDASGLKVLRAIGARGTKDGGTDGAPKDPVTITAVK